MTITFLKRWFLARNSKAITMKRHTAHKARLANAKLTNATNHKRSTNFKLNVFVIIY